MRSKLGIVQGNTKLVKQIRADNQCVISDLFAERNDLVNSFGVDADDIAGRGLEALAVNSDHRFPLIKIQKLNPFMPVAGEFCAGVHKTAPMENK